MPGVSVPAERWWPELDWELATEAPIVASGLGDALVAQIRALATT